MLTQINGLHHVTSIASGAQANNDFFTKDLGLRRVKKTVNFDAPEVYHLYYGDEVGTPGSVMTYFPFPHAARGRPGLGEVGTTVFAVPKGTLGYWQNRFQALGTPGLERSSSFGEERLHFTGPDGDAFALVETEDGRAPWSGNGVPSDEAIRGFHSAHLRVSDGGATEELLRFMGYEEDGRDGDTVRLRIPNGNGADVIDLQTLKGANYAKQGAGSVHHLAFSVDTRETQLEVRKALSDTGYGVTPVIDRDYFWAIYFRSPGGVLFEVATNEPGFDRDEDTAHLGEALQLPNQHAHLRKVLEEKYLEPIED
ncbi:MAG: dioxygenase [Maritimibacter sp.]|nr:dioxygenase [Maritimibacter sp.]